ncbi:unnamed protein product [Ilex paraguariensis]|uniref:Uncharacterized protein n=1 Tax=Ilex paraguariensis TaxID=185542 RepID=A0ABC8UKG6_9AQUA
MAPTAAMLILGYNSRSASHPSPPPPTPPSTAPVFQVKALALKWLSDNSIIQQTSETKQAMVSRSSSSSDSAVEKRYQEVLELSCWNNNLALSLSC